MNPTLLLKLVETYFQLLPHARGDMGGVLSSAMRLVEAVTGNAQKTEQVSKATRTKVQRML